MIDRPHHVLKALNLGLHWESWEESGESEAELLGETPHRFCMPGAENIADRLKDQVGCLHQRLLHTQAERWTALLDNDH